MAPFNRQQLCVGVGRVTAVLLQQTSISLLHSLHCVVIECVLLFSFQTAGGSDETFFKSLDDLILHFKRKNQGLAMHLRHSVKRKRSLLIQPRMVLERPPEQRSSEQRSSEQRSPVGCSSREVLSLPDDEDHDYESVSYIVAALYIRCFS